MPQIENTIRDPQRAGAGDRVRVSPPPLENGDRLTRAEFERRYRAMPHVTKAELIEGVVYMASPVRLRRRSRPHLHLAGWSAAYEAETPRVFGADNGTTRLDLDNEPQPDRSEVFGGLWLNAGAIARADLRAALATLHDGLGSREHADFAARLAAAGGDR